MNAVPSLVQIVRKILPDVPSRETVEALICTSLAPDSSHRDFAGTFTAAEVATPVRCTYQLTREPVGRRLMVHFKLATPMPYSWWQPIVDPLGEPQISFPPLPRLSPGAVEPRMYGNWAYRINDTTQLKLSRDSETQDVTDIYVFWRIP